MLCVSCRSYDNVHAQDVSQSQSMKIKFESDNNYTATYTEAIEHYEALAATYGSVQISAVGMTDSGFPLHEVVVSDDGVFDPELVRQNGKVIVLINNAIHPGEPCGVDASMMLARDLQTKHRELLKHAVVVIIPIYNISGHLNRGSFSRANQQGPHAYGFRGNAQNLDLNRDFIKGDTENARTFHQIFTKWSPDILIDNHTSNGADYPYVMTLIPTQKDKMDPGLSAYLQTKMLPDLFTKMDQKGYEMTPYVYARTTPDEGIAGFLDYARYSSGYASLFDCISFMPETHMLKPFGDRVKSTYLFMQSMLEHVDVHHKEIRTARDAARQRTINQSAYDLDWAIDMEKVGTVSFKGYTAKYKESQVSGLQRLYYDHGDPYEKEIPFYNTYKSTLSVDAPTAYVIPRAYKQIVDRMKTNGVVVTELSEDQVMPVEIYKIIGYNSSDSPYEGHYLHREVETSITGQNIQYHKGDYLINVGQPTNKYIVQTLEPQGPDSWFAWNYFDGILMQKEHFSAYVFEDLAADILAANPDMREALERKKMSDEDFAKSAYQQLNFVYERSHHYEPTYMRYPVGRLR